MDLVEFAALKPGDKIENNAFGVNKGEVVGATAGGVRVVWGPRHGRETVFFYSVNTTAWMHWSKPEACFRRQSVKPWTAAHD